VIFRSDFFRSFVFLMFTCMAIIILPNDHNCTVIYTFTNSAVALRAPCRDSEDLDNLCIADVFALYTSDHAVILYKC